MKPERQRMAVENRMNESGMRSFRMRKYRPNWGGLDNIDWLIKTLTPDDDTVHDYLTERDRDKIDRFIRGCTEPDFTNLFDSEGFVLNTNEFSSMEYVDGNPLVIITANLELDYFNEEVMEWATVTSDCFADNIPIDFQRDDSGGPESETRSFIYATPKIRLFHPRERQSAELKIGDY